MAVLQYKFRQIQNGKSKKQTAIASNVTNQGQGSIAVDHVFLLDCPGYLEPDLRAVVSPGLGEWKPKLDVQS